MQGQKRPLGQSPNQWRVSLCPAGSPATNSNRCHNQLITFAPGVVCILCEITKEGEELLRLAKEKAAGS